MRPIETSTSDFADLRRNGTIYVDKTAWFHRLASDVGRKICDRAFAQIRGKNYAEPYLASGSPIWLIGLSFDPDSRLLVEAAAEPYFTPKKEDRQ